jgi:hypothetical protein
MQITKLGISLALLIALALAARLSPPNDEQHASSRPSTPAIEERLMPPGLPSPAHASLE